MVRSQCCAGMRAAAFGVFFCLLAAAPLRAANDAELEKIVDPIVESMMKQNGFVGVSVGVELGSDKNPGTYRELYKGYGFADLENEIPMTADSVHRIGSISKQFTSAAIFQLVEKGKLSLDDEITKFLPDYPTHGNRVTIHHLLSHTSGIKNYTSIGKKWQENLSRDQVVELFAKEPFDFTPGEKFSYSNSGYFLLGIVIEKVSGEKYEDYLTAHVYKPAGLERTSYLWDEPIVKHRAAGYAKRGEKVVNAAPLSMGVPYAAGALGSTVGDLIRWQKALAGGMVVTRASYEKMATPVQIEGQPKGNYGYGLGQDKIDGITIVQHGGGINGFSTDLSYYPERELHVTVLLNLEGGNAGRVSRLIARPLLGLPDMMLKDVAILPAELKRYEGSFRAGEGTIRFYERSGTLRAQREGENAYVLKYQGDDEFAYQANPEQRVHFTLKDGLAERARISFGSDISEGDRVAEEAAGPPSE